jgi:3-hydroxyisobutyrate dehydrogenase
MARASQIGFVGIGNMGAPMVRCLVKGGFGVTVFDSDAARLAAFRGVDAVKVAASLPLVASQCAMVVTMLPDSRIVRRVVLGTRGSPGLSDGLGQDSLLIDMSSSYPLDTVRLGGDLAKRGAALIDAPVSGGVGKAVTGTLAIMAGGSDADVERAMPMLQAMGSVHRTGALGSGHAMKALNNYVSAAGLVATCEALMVGSKFGLDPSTMVRVLNASTGRNNTTENKADRYLVPHKFDSGFSLALMAKDVGMASKLSEELGVAADELEFVASYLKRASVALGPEADHTAVMAFVEQGEDE